MSIATRQTSSLNSCVAENCWTSSMMPRHKSTTGSSARLPSGFGELLIVVKLAAQALYFEQAVGEEQDDVMQGELATMRLIYRSVEEAKCRAGRFFHQRRSNRFGRPFLCAPDGAGWDARRWHSAVDPCPDLPPRKMPKQKG